MRTLLQILKRYWTFILFILLLLFSLKLTSNRNSMMGNDVLSSSNRISGFFYEKQHSIVQYFRLKAVNDSLLIENAYLRNLLAQNRNSDTFQDMMVSIPVIGIDSTKKINTPTNSDSSNKENDPNVRKFGERKIIKYAEYHFIPARVINNTIAHEKINFITINRGKEDGIEPNMPVVTFNGIVGRVAYVSDHYSTIVTVLSEGRTYNVKLMNGRAYLINWDVGSSNSVSMNNVPKNYDVQIGDTIYTAEYSIFPEGIMVGTVATITEDEKSNSQNIRILLSTDFRKLDYVYVVKNNLEKEKNELERQTKNELYKK